MVGWLYGSFSICFCFGMGCCCVMMYEFLIFCVVFFIFNILFLGNIDVGLGLCFKEIDRNYDVVFEEGWLLFYFVEFFYVFIFVFLKFLILGFYWRLFKIFFICKLIIIFVICLVWLCFLRCILVVFNGW